MSKKYYFLKSELPSVTSRKSRLRALVNGQLSGKKITNYAEYYREELLKSELQVNFLERKVALLEEKLKAVTKKSHVFNNFNSKKRYMKEINS
jgi:methionyl-tRNA formyltransferase